jgi:hypothetical protein
VWGSRVRSQERTFFALAGLGSREHASSAGMAGSRRGTERFQSQCRHPQFSALCATAVGALSAEGRRWGRGSWGSRQARLPPQRWRQRPRRVHGRPDRCGSYKPGEGARPSSATRRPCGLARGVRAAARWWRISRPDAMVRRLRWGEECISMRARTPSPSSCATEVRSSSAHGDRATRQACSTCSGS